MPIFQGDDFWRVPYSARVDLTVVACIRQFTEAFGVFIPV